MRKNWSRKMISFVLMLGMIFSMGSFAFAKTGTTANIGSGIQDLKVEGFRDDGRFYFSGTYVPSEYLQYVDLHAILREQDNTAVGTCVVIDDDDGNAQTFLAYFTPAFYRLDDGMYFISAADMGLNFDINSKNLPERGYRVDFEMKGNEVVSGWDDGSDVKIEPTEEEKNQHLDSTGKMIPSVTKANFSDVSGHWAQSSIEKLAGNKILNGYPDGTFKPNATISRAEFAQVVSSAFGYSGSKGSAPFTDVPSAKWFSAAVNALNEKQIVSGITAVEFRPDQAITREQMASIFYRAAMDKQLTLKQAREYVAFSDETGIQSYAKDAVTALYQNGTISGKLEADGIHYRFGAKENATRAEVAVMIDSLLYK